MPKNQSFRCWVPHCANSRKRTRIQNSHYHAFPVRNAERCRRWLKLVGYEDLVYLPMHSLRMRYVCSEHFTEEDYGRCSSNPNLYSTAVPSKFPAGTVPLSDEIMAEWPPKLASDKGNTQGNAVKANITPEAVISPNMDLFPPPSPVITSSSADKLLASVVSAGILEQKVEPDVHVQLNVSASVDTNLQLTKSVTVPSISRRLTSTPVAVVQTNNPNELRLPQIPQELLMNHLRQNSGQGLIDGDVLLGFIVERGPSLEVVPVGPNHSMVVASCVEELMSPTCPVSSSNGVENAR